MTDMRKRRCRAKHQHQQRQMRGFASVGERQGFLRDVEVFINDIQQDSGQNEWHCLTLCLWLDGERLISRYMAGQVAKKTAAALRLLSDKTGVWSYAWLDAQAGQLRVSTHTTPDIQEKFGAAVMLAPSIRRLMDAYYHTLRKNSDAGENYKVRVFMVDAPTGRQPFATRRADAV